MNEDTPMNVAAPKFRFEWNLNTLVVLAGFAGGLIAWGYTLSDIQKGRSINEANITSLSDRVSVNEIAIRRIDNHEYRISNMEKTATDAAITMKSLDKSINDLSGDMRVVREILQRIETAQKARFQP